MAANGVPERIGNEDLPALFRDADAASQQAQRTYLAFVFANLAILVAVPLLGSLGLRGLVTALLLAGSALTLWLAQRAYQKVWFGGRAMAESVKSMAWQYMMGAPPYEASDERSADARFAEDLRETLREGKALAATLGAAGEGGDEITRTMRSVRAADPEARKALYLAERLAEQRRWYAAKAGSHRRFSQRFLAAIAVLQLFGALCTFLQDRFAAWAGGAMPDLAARLGGPVGIERIAVGAVCAALASAFLSWLQLRQHQELASAYGMATHELGLAAATAARWPAEELGKLVDEAERTISREHTMWVARRNTPGR
jgi:hypothetical protein